MGEVEGGDGAADISWSKEVRRRRTYIAIGRLICRMRHQDVVYLEIDGGSIA